MRAFRAYLKAVFVEGFGRILTLFDLIGIIIFLFPRMGITLVDNTELARLVGLSIFLVSFVIANFAAYRALLRKVPAPMSSECIRLYPNLNAPLVGGELRYFCSEPARSFTLEISYLDRDGMSHTSSINRFYSKEDPKMHGFPRHVNVIEPGDVLYFDLPSGDEIGERKFLITLSVTGAISTSKIEVERELDIEQILAP